MKFVTKNRKTILRLLLAVLVIMALFLAYTLSVKSFYYQTSTACYPNLLPGGPEYKTKTFKVIAGEKDDFDQAVSKLKQQNIPQLHQSGCQYEAVSYQLKLF